MTDSSPLPTGRQAQADANHENTSGVRVRVMVRKPVSFRGRRLREILEPKDVTE